MEYLSIRQVAEKWGLSARRINVLCSEGRIEGATNMSKRNPKTRTDCEGQEESRDQIIGQITW